MHFTIKIHSSFFVQYNTCILFFVLFNCFPFVYWFIVLYVQYNPIVILFLIQYSFSTIPVYWFARLCSARDI